MVPATLVSVEEYLRTSFEEADREFIDGAIVERNVGELPHSRAQSLLVALLNASGLFALTEQRVQVKPTRFRVPDVCASLTRPQERILHTPPFLVVEILSRDDRAAYVQEKLSDYLDFGVPNVWIVDPEAKSAWMYTQAGGRAAVGGVLRTVDPVVEVTLDQFLDWPA